jgi:glutamate formiminotransferase
VLIECVPNVSEGRRLEVIDRLRDAIVRQPGVRLLDVSADRSHNRSVFTLVGGPDALEAAVTALVEGATAEIDLRHHEGVHPRIGAVDVIPFVPLGETAMSTCIALAARAGRLIADRFEIPVFLYGRGAPSRTLAALRRGGVTGLAARMASGECTADFGPSRPHPTAGACAVGARPVLIAYNVNLESDRVEIARAIAATIRASNGGLPHVQALGLTLADRGIVQVSTNVTDYTVTSLRTVFDAVAQEARRYGVAVKESELVGLAPAAALTPEIAQAIHLRSFDSRMILERQLDGL